MNEKILSIIVPTYNMEQYLSYCLDSFCITQNADKLEVLIVNDGSTDKSLEIARRYESYESGIFSVINKNNGNYGSCINTALPMATGKYVKVVDADDSVDTENLDGFISFLGENDADLVLSDFAVMDADRNIRKVAGCHIGEGKTFRMDDVCTRRDFKSMQMHMVTYRRKNLMCMNYHQSEGISYTDQQWILMPMITVRRVAYYHRCVYKYLVGREGQTIAPEVKLRSMGHMTRCAVDMAADYERRKQDIPTAQVREYLFARMVAVIKDIYVFMFTHYDVKTRNMLIEFDNRLAKSSCEVYDCIANRNYVSFMGFEYIGYWRRHKEMNVKIMKVLCRSCFGLLVLKRNLSRRAMDV